MIENWVLLPCWLSLPFKLPECRKIHAKLLLQKMEIQGFWCRLNLQLTICQDIHEQCSFGTYSVYWQRILILFPILACMVQCCHMNAVQHKHMYNAVHKDIPYLKWALCDWQLTSSYCQFCNSNLKHFFFSFTKIKIPVCFHKGWAWATIHSSRYNIFSLFSFVEWLVNDMCYEIAKKKTSTCSES